MFRSITLEAGGREAGLARALKRLLIHLTIWPAPRLAAWVEQILEAVREPSILAAVTEASLLPLARSLQIPLHRPQTQRLFFLLLYRSEQQDLTLRKVGALDTGS